jgi:hypothetical protein
MKKKRTQPPPGILVVPVGDLEAAIRSAVRAVLPGRQQQKNLAPLLATALKAARRTLQRRGTDL